MIDKNPTLRHSWPIPIYILHGIFHNILDEVKWDEGACSGTVYSGEDDLTQLMAKVRGHCGTYYTSALVFFVLGHNYTRGEALVIIS